MLFAISCIDKTGAAQVRADNRDAHLAYLKEHSDQMVIAGPYLNESGDGMAGSLLILDFPDRVAAEAFAANDPYAKAGLFESVDIRQWKKVLPAG